MQALAGSVLLYYRDLLAIPGLLSVTVSAALLLSLLIHRHPFAVAVIQLFFDLLLLLIRFNASLIPLLIRCDRLHYCLIRFGYLIRGRDPRHVHLILESRLIPSLPLPELLVLVRSLRCRHSTHVLRRGLNVGDVLLGRHITPVVISWDMLSLDVLRRLIHHN